MTDLERIPPQAVDLEQAVLGAMLLDHRAIDQVREQLSTNSFYFSPHATIFRVICDLHDHGKPADQLTVTEDLRTCGQLDDVGGVVYIAKLASEVASSANVVAHASIVQQKAMLREVIARAYTLSELAYEQSEPAQTLIGQAIDKLSSLEQGNGIDGLLHIDQVIPETLDLIEKACRSKGKTTGVSSRLPSLDALTGGFQPGDLVILAARPSVGKTALALQWAHSGADRTGTAAFFSLEMSRTQLVQRLVAQATRIDLHRLRTGKLTDDEWQAVARASAELSSLKLHIDDRAGLTVPYIRGQCRKLQARDGLSLIILDYLQLMSASEKTSSREQEISRISRGLKGIAKEFGVPVIALSQLSRSSVSRKDKRARLEDLRESGAIEQDADVVMFLNKPEGYGEKTVEVRGEKVDSANMVELDLGKQRNGPTASFWMRWDKSATLFAELAQVDMFDEEEAPFESHDNE